MRVVSLFSGMGGFDLAARWMGWTTIAYTEIEPWACRTMAHHFPEAVNLGDITTVDWRTVERPDLLVGGFPCQPASHAGKRQGTDDERWLWPEFARAIGVLRPRWVVAENVPGLLTVNGGAAFAEVVGDLRRLGYVGLTVPVSAADMGAPHRRERIWIVAHAAGGRREQRDAGERAVSVHGASGGELGHAEQSGREGLAGDGDGRRESGRLPAHAGRSTPAASASVFSPPGPTGSPCGEPTAPSASSPVKPWATPVAAPDAPNTNSNTVNDIPSPGGQAKAFAQSKAAYNPRFGLALMGLPADWLGRPGVRGPEAWTTPQAHDAGARGSGQRAKRAAGDMTNGNACLPSDAKDWATPQHGDGAGGRTCHGEGGGESSLNADTRGWGATSADWHTVWPVVSGMPNRAAGCRLVGNSVIPQIPLSIFMAIERVDGARRG